MSFTTGCLKKTELHWEQEHGYRWAAVSPGYFDNVGFNQLDPSETAIHFQNNLSKEEITANRILLNGSGVAAGDIDGDGWVDLYFAQLEGPNKLYRNAGGLRFEDITKKAGVAHNGYHSTGVTFADVDGDGDLDLLVTSLLEKNVLYVNDGNGNFKLKKDSGLGAARGSTSMALADIDEDGDLDLYITNYKKKTVRDIYRPKELRLKNTIKAENDEFKILPPFDKYYQMIYTENRPYRKEYGETDELYINNGNGFFDKIEDLESRFLDQVGTERGLSQDWGLTAKFGDLNGDSRPDLYVCNDFWTPDRVWINRGDGVFKAIDSTSIRNFSLSSMAVDFSDINRDGAIDFFVSEMLSPVHQRRMRQLSEYLETIDHHPQYNRNSLYLSRGDQTYAEIARFSGLEASGWSWATNFLDVDLDGYEDLAITTGNAHDVEDLDSQLKINKKVSGNEKLTDRLLEFPPLRLSNRLYRNNRDLTFSDKSADWGFNEKDVSHGMALADLDNDGDLDIITNRLNETAGVYENIATAPRIAVRLVGKKPNTQAIGAHIKLTGGPVDQDKEIVSGGGYLSGSDPFVVFAGSEDNSHLLTVRWPDGNHRIIDSVKPGRMYEIYQATASPNVNSSAKKKKRVSEPFFGEISDRINHTHHENTFNDFSIQPLLPIKLSQRGPGVAWIDFDQDKDEDLFIGTGKGGKTAVYENLGGTDFKSSKTDELTNRVSGDQTAIIGWKEKDRNRIFVGNSNYEQKGAHGPSAFQYIIDQNQHIEKDSLPSIFSTTGPLAATDYDADGDVDLFTGGNFKPGLFPMNADSRLFKNEDGHFQLDKVNSHKLKEIGLVTGAVFTDYDQDGDQDLLLSREWDSIILLENENGIFNDISDRVGLSDYKGWWNGITTGDFNNDGLPDIVVTNIGLNSSYQLGSRFPYKIYYNDLNRDGHLDILEAYYNRPSQSYVPRRRLYEFDAISNALRHIKSHRQFANLSVEEIFNRDFGKIPSKEINTLKNMLFLNKGDNFRPSPLPDKAQLSAAFYAGVADFDNDGNEDLFITQNFFDFSPGVSRLDAGRGLWLQGNGKGDFEAVTGNKTGIKVYGEQRGAAISDFNRDGKVDLVISQNGGVTKLYLNKMDKRGIRIRLVGPDQNKDGIGSSIRLIYKDGSKGPIREIQAGSGYWSQNSFVKILGISALPLKIEVNWFDGTSQTVDIVNDKIEYEISY